MPYPMRLLQLFSQTEYAKQGHGHIRGPVLFEVHTTKTVGRRCQLHFAIEAFHITDVRRSTSKSAPPCEASRKMLCLKKKEEKNES